jgi:hypothetical protein
MTTPKSITGKYTAQLTSDGLRAAGVDYVNVGGGGLWHLTVTKNKLSLAPPPPADDSTDYAIASVKAGQLTLGPEKACSTTEGKTQKSTFTFSESSAGLKFNAVKVACKEDGGSLAVAPWHKQ